ncbi:dynamin family protein [Dactylosporangium darangshiense]
MVGNSGVRADLHGCADLAALGGPATQRLEVLLRLAASRLDEPMRVAVVGQIKRGKSTLVNALLGEDVSATGDAEVTYTVTELFHSGEPVLIVRYKDGSEEAVPLDHFDRVTSHDERNLAVLRQIRTVLHGRDNPLLRSFRLIDTPGLASVHGADSDNTAAQLGITSFGIGDEAAAGRSMQDVHDDSEEEIGKADAVLYLFSRGLHEKDQAAALDVAGSLAGSVTPLKSFGVLSRCDQQWPPSPELPGDPDPLTFDPMAVSQEIAEKYLARPDVGRLFYTIVPVAGLVGAGAQTLSGNDFADLADLAAIEPRTLVRRLRDAGRFATRPELAGVALPVERRASLERRLSVWGILRACTHLREGLGEAQVREQLVIDSGVHRLRALITEHFGNRAAVIKLDHGLRSVTGEIAAVRRAAQQTGAAPAPQVAEVAARIERVRRGQHAFAEMSVLAEHYLGRIGFSPEEVADLLRVTGEYGVSCAARLGLPDATPVAELDAAASARISAWARREQDPMLDRHTARAAYTVRRSYERVAFRVRRAAALLGGGDEFEEA